MNSTCLLYAIITMAAHFSRWSCAFLCLDLSDPETEIRLSMDIKVYIHIYIHIHIYRFFVDIHGYIRMHRQGI